MLESRDARLPDFLSENLLFLPDFVKLVYVVYFVKLYCIKSEHTIFFLNFNPPYMTLTHTITFCFESKRDLHVKCNTETSKFNLSRVIHFSF